MELILDGNSVIGAHILSILEIFDMFKALDREIGFFFLPKDSFSFMRALYLLNDHLL